MKNLFAIIMMVFTANSALTQNPGALDTTFGGTGIVTTAIGSGDDFARSTAIQADGKIVLAGYTFNGTDNDFAIVRYNTNGTLDVTFGTGGKVVTPIGPGNDEGNAVELQSDGKIVVAGITNDGTITAPDFAVVRYNTDGTLDNTFGTGGIVITAIGPYDDYTYALAIQSDGKIVVAGYSYMNSWDYNDFSIVRYNTDGTLDNTFGTGGIVNTGIGYDTDVSQGVAIQSDGKIVVTGFIYNSSGNSSFATARFNTDGTFDNTFTSDGKVVTPIGGIYDLASAVDIQTDGKIVVTGYTWEMSSGYYNFAIVRYNTDGTLDNTFGTGGIVITSVGGSDDIAIAAALQNDGKIVVAGFTLIGTSNPVFAVVRYNTDGTLDNVFDSDGIVKTSIGGIEDKAYSVAIQSDGRIVVAGYSKNSTDKDFAVVRYGGDTTVGNEEIIPDNEISIFPNPANDYLTIEIATPNTVISNDVVISIYNIQGELLTLQPINQAKTEINISSLAKGLYIIKASNLNGIVVKKLVKE